MVHARSPMHTAHPIADPFALIQRALRWTKPFDAWPDRAVEGVADIARLERYDKRTQVLARNREAREVLIVVSGCLEVSRVNSAGVKFVLTLLGAGEVVALIRLLPELPLHYDYHAHVDTVLLHLPSDDLRAVLDAHPILWRDIAFLAMSRQSDSIVLLQQRALGGLQQGVAQTILKLLTWYGETTDEPQSVRLRLSQNDLASMLGVTRQTMNKELRELSTLGLISIDYGRLIVRDADGLQAVASQGS